MRSELEAIEGQRTRFRGTVQKISNARQSNIPTAAIENVTAVRLGGPTIQHVWIRGEICNQLKPGDLIYFDATVFRYVAGNTQWAWRPLELPVKFGLRNPTNLLKAKMNYVA